MDPVFSPRIPRTWSLPAQPFSLAPGEITVWKFVPAELDKYSAQFEKLLSSHERQRLERFADADARREFLICRGVLHWLLAVLSGEELSALQIREDSLGKPHLETEAHTYQLEFNIAHTKGLCLIACARELALGVDVERVQPLPELNVMAQKYLAPREKAMWDRVPASQKTELFHQYWSAKEALLKAFGSGLRISPAQVDTLEVLEGKTITGQQDDGNYFEINACLLTALPQEGSYTAWLAALDRPEQISLYELANHCLERTAFFVGRKVE